MGWWDERADRLQAKVICREMENLPGDDFYEQIVVKRAIIHTREDVVMIYSQLSSLNAQLFVAKWALLAIVALLAYAVFSEASGQI